jgi:hypothetical protein
VEDDFLTIEDLDVDCNIFSTDGFELSGITEFNKIDYLMCFHKTAQQFVYFSVVDVINRKPFIRIKDIIYKVYYGEPPYVKWVNDAIYLEPL